MKKIKKAQAGGMFGTKGKQKAPDQSNDSFKKAQAAYTEKPFPKAKCGKKMKKGK